ncbi:MAG: hypothetical protein B7Z14_03885 [Bosea sp. 32-68-6]|nr:MAG: hypothetical protein B7Z14_03885 [Bosea sp. 32-68-6]
MDEGDGLDALRAAGRRQLVGGGHGLPVGLPGPCPSAADGHRGCRRAAPRRPAPARRIPLRHPARGGGERHRLRASAGPGRHPAWQVGPRPFLALRLPPRPATRRRLRADRGGQGRLRLVRWTAAERARKGDEVFVLDFGDPEGRTHRWNPLGLVRRGTPDATDDLQKAMFALVPETRANNPYWDNAGRRVATALAVIQSETPGAPLTVATVAGLARRGDCVAHLRTLVADARREGHPYPRAAVETALGWADGLEKGSEEARGVRQTILTALSLWEVPRIAAATAASDFDVRELRSRRMSVYLCAQPSDLRRMRPIYAIFFQQLIDAMAREEFGEKREHRHRVLALLDEFWALGEHKVLADATAFIRSSGLRMAIVVQSKDQTRLAFGEDGSRNIYANAGAEIALGGLDQRQAEEVSQRGGSDTVVETTQSRPRFFGWLSPSRQSESETVRRRALMLAQEVQRLAPDKLLVLRRRLALLMLDRLVWYRDPHFRDRAGEPPAVPILAVRVERDAASPPEDSE